MNVLSENLFFARRSLRGRLPGRVDEGGNGDGGAIMVIIGICGSYSSREDSIRVDGLRVNYH